MVRCALLAVLLVFAACAPAQTRPTISTPPRGTVLCVVNDAAGVGQITARGAGHRWAVQPGQKECKTLRALPSGMIRLEAHSIGGGMRPVREREEWYPGLTRCWEWRIQSGAGGSSLVPCGIFRTDGAAAMAVEADTSALWMQVKMHEAMMGLTTCGSRPLGWVRVDVLLGDEGAQTVAHEMQHVATVLRDGGCQPHFARVQADPQVRVEAEAEAFCASAKVWSRQTSTPLEAAVQKYAEWLSKYGFGLTPAAAADRIRRYCSVPW